jgi:hypothetical protein
MTDIHNHPAFLEGQRCYLNGLKYDNPYAVGSDEYNAFERGWSQALKRVPESVAKRLEQQRKDNHLPKDKALKKARDDYLRRKG